MSKVHYADTTQFNKTAEYLMSQYILELPHDVGLEDILLPHFWKNVAHRLKRLSIVTCIGGKDELDVDLRVMASGQGYCMMRVIRVAPPPVKASVTAATASRGVKMIPGKKWCVTDELGEVVVSGLASQEEAAKRFREIEAA